MLKSLAPENEIYFISNDEQTEIMGGARFFNSQ